METNIEKIIDLVNISAGYDTASILKKINLKVHRGEVVSLMGRNGMGKSTTMKIIMGIIQPTLGQRFLFGRDTQNFLTHQIAQMGIGYVPEARNIFPTLSVRENLVATASNRLNKKDPWLLEQVIKLFPRLGERINQKGNALSGGEQQMLAIGRALMTNPSILLLDEATEGLAPMVREEIWSTLEHSLKASDQTILIIDRYPEALAKIADRHYVIENGKIVWTGDSESLIRQRDKISPYLHLG